MPVNYLILFLQTLDEQELFTDEELDAFEKEYERRQLEEYDGQVPPGVVNVRI